jgi:exosome complex exonuclease DIS3/RRP44
MRRAGTRRRSRKSAKKARKAQTIAMTEVGTVPSRTGQLLDADGSAIRKTLQYYSEHLLSSAARPPQLVLLTDDKRNRELAHADGMLAVSTRDYVDGLDPKEREKLVDLVVGGVDEIEPGERRGRRLYDEVSEYDGDRFCRC